MSILGAGALEKMLEPSLYSLAQATATTQFMPSGKTFVLICKVGAVPQLCTP